MKTTVNKSDYQIFQFNSGYLGICEKGKFGGGCVFGGDSANDDDYNREYIEQIFNNWNGELIDGRIQA